MPLHDFICERCDKVEERYIKFDDLEKQVCKCGGKMRHVYLKGAPVHIFREGFYEHLDVKPIYIKSKKQLKAECAERGLTSHYVD